MRNLRIALGLRLLRRELGEASYDAHKAFAYVDDHDTRRGGYVQGRLSGVNAIRKHLHRAATPGEVVERFTRHWPPPRVAGSADRPPSKQPAAAVSPSTPPP
jgi:hypothetical protein